MEFWKVFWTLLLFASMALFAGLAVVISLGGVSDILALFRRIDGQRLDQGKDENQKI